MQTYINRSENKVIDSWVAEGERWRLEGEYEPALKARGPIIELHLNWLDCLTFSDGDAYHWHKVGSPQSAAVNPKPLGLQHKISKKQQPVHACCVIFMSVKAVILAALYSMEHLASKSQIGYLMFQHPSTACQTLTVSCTN